MSVLEIIIISALTTGILFWHFTPYSEMVFMIWGGVEDVSLSVGSKFFGLFGDNSIAKLFNNTIESRR